MSTTSVKNHFSKGGRGTTQPSGEKKIKKREKRKSVASTYLRREKESDAQLKEKDHECLAGRRKIPRGKGEERMAI